MTKAGSAVSAQDDGDGIDDVARFAALLRALKERTDRSYGSLARRLGMNTSTLHRYCAGDTVPLDFAPVERFAALCGATSQQRLELHRCWLLAVAARRRPPAAGAARSTPDAAVAEPVTPEVAASEAVHDAASPASSLGGADPADPADRAADGAPRPPGPSSPPRPRHPAYRRRRLVAGVVSV
ncbi:helix-turn-helix domain-containing protein, partial [Streptomyces flavofungini]|uniref:helix-turn-helix domain-containing protein n=1 Tax=Streptomyces flavofungini TaxID=68200 RepID=UPI003F81492A